jgi:hypothetical protein
VEAALSLIKMKPRAGRRVGIGIMVDTLANVAPEPRQGIVAAQLPAIIAEIKKPPPPAQAGQKPPDDSYPYKDAAYALLTNERPVLIADEALKQNLKQALIDWAMADFENRLDNRTQSYGMEQLLRFIGAPAVAGLPKLMTKEAKRLDQMASIVSELGEPKTKDAASQAIVSIAQYVLSEDWLKVKKPELEAANKASKLEPTEAQFKAQLAQYQEEELFRVFAAMKKVGGGPARPRSPRSRGASTGVTPTTSSASSRSPRARRPTGCSTRPSAASARCRASRSSTSSTSCSRPTSGRSAGPRPAPRSRCRRSNTSTSSWASCPARRASR